MLDSAQAGHKVGVRSVMISNGFIRAEPMQKLLPHLDAVKIDLKSISDRFYRDYCAGELGPVLDTIKLVKHSGKWLELVYLVVPTLNDTDAAVRQMCEWVLAAVGAETPLHFSRFYPNYQLKKLPPTPYATMERCWKIAREVGLKYVYVGNVPDTAHVHTVCPQCGKAVVQRSGYQIVAMNLRNGACKFCARKIPGVWA
jgi:pyruvate formate lyase activating enzyme